jgi:hypothetical protein
MVRVEALHNCRATAPIAATQLQDTTRGLVLVQFGARSSEFKL